MGKQPMVAHADTRAAGKPPEEDSQRERLPGKHKECDHRADVECEHEKGRDQVDWLLERSVA
jgi:hypothetical protein